MQVSFIQRGSFFCRLSRIVLLTWVFNCSIFGWVEACFCRLPRHKICLFLWPGCVSQWVEASLCMLPERLVFGFSSVYHFTFWMEAFFCKLSRNLQLALRRHRALFTDTEVFVCYISLWKDAFYPMHLWWPSVHGLSLLTAVKAL